MPFYAVIDTNVLVSAFLKSNSIPRIVMDYVYSGEIIPLFNDEILSEYREVLARPKFHFPKDAVEIAVEKIKEIGLHFDSVPVSEDIPDPKDIVFYAVTMNARNEKDAYLVTGNTKHFPAKTFVVTPRQILNIVENTDH
ncbi:MAG: putative toxin-antitoxin system toxin component, PIN family [Treponema sp.]|nr:putative toxin-antitoxin system toxin component, PIN family [Treponema sp.]